MGRRGKEKGENQKTELSERRVTKKSSLNAQDELRAIHARRIESTDEKDKSLNIVEEDSCQKRKENSSRM